MTIDRRQFVVRTAASGAAVLTPIPAIAAPAIGEALPMPAPTDALPPPALVQDPSRVLLDQGWLFHEGDIVPAPPLGHNATYLSVKAGNAQGAAAVDYDDSDWAPVTLPHDWASFQPFVETANLSQGYRPRGIGWYRRTLHLDPADRGKQIELQFGGIATNATIWINGSVVAHNFSGYNSVYVDMTPFARFGDAANVIVVRVDATVMEGWWYEGAGLYRHVWLAVRAPVSIATDGVHCDPRRGSDGRWTIPVVVTARSIEDVAVPVRITATLLDPAGKTIATMRSDAIAVPPLGESEAAVVLSVDAPALWSVDSPALYTVAVALERDGRTVDERRVPIGFRTIRFDADKGFFLNDRHLKIKGVCIHQDHAGVGTAVPDALIAWRLQRLKAMGCNAIRSSHNAPAQELLDHCDRLGLLVMDENRQFNPSPDYMAQLRWLIRRDRNHPSVILWSVFNEEPMQGTEAGVQMVRRMAHAVHELDDSRPVTAAMNGAFFDPANVSQVVDVTGFNYYPGDYDRFHAANPTKPMTSSEDTSAFMTRGAFANDPARHISSSYDTEAASWGETHRKAWKLIADRPFVAGGFVWTGFDYHGEPTPFDWPTIASVFGIMDLCGFPKTAFDIHRANWVDDETVSLAPHWTWPGREGQPIEILVMSNADRVELRLNGRPVGTAVVDRAMGNVWHVPYAPGRIEVIAYRGDRVVARAVHETAGAPVALRLTPARRVMAGDGEDAQPVTIDAVDAQGRHVPTANPMTHFAVTGAAIIGVGNGDPNSHEPEKGGQRSLFNGLAQMIVQSAIGRGAVTIRATAEGLRPATLRIDRLAVPPRAQVPVIAPETEIATWRRSPPLAAAPSPDLAPADNDMNSWATIRAWTPTPPEPVRRWWVYRAVVLPSRRVAQAGGTLIFAGIAGRAELWIDGGRVATKTRAATGAIEAAVAPGTAPRHVVLIVDADPGGPSGIVGRVTLRSRP